MTYTLHKLPEEFIIISDEKIEKLNHVLHDNYRLIYCWDEESSKLWNDNKDFFKKVIAQQNQIDFSALSEKEQKEIGWFDINQLAKEYAKEHVGNAKAYIDEYLSKPKSWKVELEMEKETLYTKDGLDYKGKFKPKFTDGKVKILKILS